MLDRLRPQHVRPESYAAADKAVADLLAAEALEAAGGTEEEGSDDEQDDVSTGAAVWPLRASRTCVPSAAWPGLQGSKAANMTAYPRPEHSA